MPILRVDNFLSLLVQTFKGGDNPTIMAKQMISKMQLTSKMHGEVTRNSTQAQARWKCAYASQKGKQTFLGFKEGITLVKMKTIGKKKSLASSWEGPFLFVNYLDENGFMDHDEGGRICVIKGKND